MNEIEYIAHHGTTFQSAKALGKITITRPERLADALFAADCIEFGGFHGTQIHPKLQSFQGYDCIAVALAPRGNSAIMTANLKDTPLHAPLLERLKGIFLGFGLPLDLCARVENQAPKVLVPAHTIITEAHCDLLADHIWSLECDPSPIMDRILLTRNRLKTEWIEYCRTPPNNPNPGPKIGFGRIANW
jgi:hypothetical protein